MALLSRSPKAEPALGQNRTVGHILSFLTWIIGLAFFFPLFWLTVNGFKEEAVASADPTLRFEPTLDRFTEVTEANSGLLSFAEAFMNSLWIVLISTALVMLPAARGLDAAVVLCRSAEGTHRGCPNRWMQPAGADPPSSPPDCRPRCCGNRSVVCDLCLERVLLCVAAEPDRRIHHPGLGQLTTEVSRTVHRDAQRCVGSSDLPGRYRRLGCTEANDPWTGNGSDQVIAGSLHSPNRVAHRRSQNRNNPQIKPESSSEQLEQRHG